MFKKVLVANRGEIAVRIIRACRELGIRTIAIYSEADKNALHTTLADEAICIGPAISRKSYLNIKAILEAACVMGADSIHPGYGFLSENAKFAKLCEEIGLKFIGPSSDVIELLGNKAKAKETMKKAGVPVVPGSEGILKSKEEALKLAEEIKYPVMLKASAGGGGKGIRIVNSKNELEKAYDLVKQEAKSAFNDESIYLEKVIQNPRHIEIQVLADEHGNCVHLGERDCTIQRNNQKVIEETPSSLIDEKTRERIGQIATNAAKEIGYTNAGTIEFLLDKDKNFYFMEMNTRIQVEHPVTEMLTGIDIVKEQIKIASGEELEYKQKDIKLSGHSIEARINAENPSKKFRPCPGLITGLHLPGGNGIRVDTAIYSGYTIPPTYDSMIAKIIAHGKNRGEAISKLKSAVAEVVVEGIDTNVEFILDILKNADFVTNNYDTSFIERNMTKNDN